MSLMVCRVLRALFLLAMGEIHHYLVVNCTGGAQGSERMGDIEVTTVAIRAHLERLEQD
jgi:hypothetical protein